MKRRVSAFIAAGLTAAAVLTGCAGGGAAAVEKDTVLKPGTYTGQSSESAAEDGGGYAIVTLTVGSDNQVESVEFETYEKNGDSKDTDSYGTTNAQSSDGEPFDNAQAAREACDSYVEQYMEKKNIEDIDAISGATVSYNQFKEALGIALQKAAE